MTQRLAEIEDRIQSFEQLRAVIGAMRGIAAARSGEASRQVESIRAYARTIGEAIGQALALVPATPRTPPPGDGEGGAAVIILAAEHGLAGAFSERVFEALDLPDGARPDIFVVGSRGLPVAAERGLTVRSSTPMISHPEQVTPLATRLAETIYQSLAQDRIRKVSVIHAVPDGGAGVSIANSQLIPFDYSRFSAPATGQPPLINIPPEQLLSRLVDEYLFAEIGEAVVLSLAAENEARVRAMIAAHANISRSLSELTGTARRLRQEAITEEIVELVTRTVAPG